MGRYEQTGIQDSKSKATFRVPLSSDQLKKTETKFPEKEKVRINRWFELKWGGPGGFGASDCGFRRNRLKWTAEIREKPRAANEAGRPEQSPTSGGQAAEGFKKTN